MLSHNPPHALPHLLDVMQQLPVLWEDLQIDHTHAHHTVLPAVGLVSEIGNEVGQEHRHGLALDVVLG